MKYHSSNVLAAQLKIRLFLSAHNVVKGTYAPLDYVEVKVRIDTLSTLQQAKLM